MDTVRILGAGLMCIDIVHNINRTAVMNGGSCANVISVLSQIGFDCSIIRERHSDYFEPILSKTLSSFGVNEILYKMSSSNTPKIIEILSDSEHTFLTRCPKCGSKTLNLNLPTELDVERVNVDFSRFGLFYCDRTSSGIRKIMDVVREKLGVVVYEPNTARNVDSLIDSANHADILKFSKDRVYPSIAERIRTEVAGVKLIISTEGEKGLSFSHIQANGEMSPWVAISSEFSGPIVDSSGAGDWLTAGFISELLRCDAKYLHHQFYDEHAIAKMLSQGMKYSQLCCAAIGAQGVFYSEQSVTELYKLNNRFEPTYNNVLGEESIALDGLCPMCLSKTS